MSFLKEKQQKEELREQLVFWNKMLRFLLLSVVLAEAGASLVLIYGSPSVLYSTVMCAIQSFNHGGPVSLAHKGFAGSLALLLAPTLFRIFRVRRRIAHSGFPAAFFDLFTLQTHLIEASFIGLAYYLFLIVCHLHAHVCGVVVLRKQLESLKRQGAETSLDASGLLNHGSLLGKEEVAYRQKIDALETMVLDLRKKIEELKMECKAKDKEIRAAEANTKALQKQSEGFLLEYDRLLEDNQVLRGQLSVVDKKLYHSESNKKKS